MSLFISIIIGALVICPFLVSVSIYGFQRWTGRPISMKKNADYTTPLLFLSVYIIAHTLFGDGIGYGLIITAIVLGILVSVYEKRRVKEFEIGIVLRKIWRLYFILLAITYILLIITGITLTIIYYVT